MEPTPLDDLAAHAHETHVVVVGGGIGGLVAALACAKVGIRVTVLEASDRLGGAVCTVDIAGLRVDIGAEGYATRGGAVRGLVDELDLTDAVVPTAPRAEWISGLPGGAAPVPEATVRGIPENPWEASVRRLIGRRGTWRAYLDRLRPPLTIGQERSLGRLVRTRMGELVLDRVVAPLSLGGFSIHPDDVDVELVAPGLNAALTRTGSLAGAVMQLRADRGPKPAGDGLEGIDGGMTRLIDALHDRLHTLGAEVRLNNAVDALERRDDGRWSVLLAAAEAHEIDIADAVILAAGADEAHRLLDCRRPRAGAYPRHRARGRDTRRRVQGPRRRTGAHRGLPRARHGGCRIRHRLDRALAVDAAGDRPPHARAEGRVRRPGRRAGDRGAR